MAKKSKTAMTKFAHKMMVILCILLFLAPSNATEMVEEVVGSPRRPKSIDAGLYCFTCQLLIDMAVQTLGALKQEHEIRKVISVDKLCNPDRYFDKSIDIDEK